jgi:hypothetical protein
MFHSSKVFDSYANAAFSACGSFSSASLEAFPSTKAYDIVATDNLRLMQVDMTRTNEAEYEEKTFVAQIAEVCGLVPDG